MTSLILASLLLFLTILGLFTWRLRAVRSGRLPLFALLLSLPWLALALYLAVGHPEALLAPKAPPSLEAAVEGLKKRLEENPSDLEGWVLLARSYQAMGRFQEAVQSYRRAVELSPEDLDLKARYAEALAALRGSFSGEPRQLLEEILEENPNHPYALWLSGLDALQRGDREEAGARLGKLLSQIPPGTEAARELRALMARHGLLEEDRSAAKAREIRVTVKLDPRLEGSVPEGAILMVFARAAEGPRMPLAVVKRPLGKLPATVTLSDQDAPLPQMALSRFERVVVTARISRTGQARPQPGDLEGSSGPVRPGEVVEVVINRSLE